MAVLSAFETLSYSLSRIVLQDIDSTLFVVIIGCCDGCMFGSLKSLFSDGANMIPIQL